MSVAENWVEALHIDPEKLNEWSSLAPEGVPMLVWCLQEGHISAEHYLAWATQRYELPIVRPEYFNEAFDTAMALQLHKEVSTSGREWSPWFFPVEKWENVTLVACVEPPPEFDEPGFRCILADARSLKDAWYRFMAPSESETSQPMITAPEMPAGMETSQVHTVVKPFKLSLDNLEGDNMFVHKEPNKDELYSGYKDEETSAKATTPPLPQESDEEEEKSMVAEVLSAKTPPPEPEIDEEGSRMHTHLDLSQLAHLPPPPEAPRAPTPPVPVAQPKPSAKPKAPSATPTKKPGKALKESDLETLIAETFSQLAGLYKNSFLMRCTDGNAVLEKWDGSLKPTKENISVDLAFPTFFRIVNKTHLPYHGYLVDSPAHRSFFAELNIQELPECVTALPIKNEENLIGVLVSIGDEPLQKLEMLKKAEKATDTLIHALASTWGGAKAA